MVRQIKSRLLHLRTQLIHGARAALTHFAKTSTWIGEWIRQLLTRAHPNVLVVALAARLARISGRCCDMVVPLNTKLIQRADTRQRPVIAPEMHARSVEVNNRWRNGRAGVSAAWLSVPSSVGCVARRNTAPWSRSPLSRKRMQNVRPVSVSSWSASAPESSTE